MSSSHVDVERLSAENRSLRAELEALRSRMDTWNQKAAKGFSERFVSDTIDGVLVNMQMKGDGDVVKKSARAASYDSVAEGEHESWYQSLFGAELEALNGGASISLSPSSSPRRSPPVRLDMDAPLINNGGDHGLMFRSPQSKFIGASNGTIEHASKDKGSSPSAQVYDARMHDELEELKRRRQELVQRRESLSRISPPRPPSNVLSSSRSSSADSNSKAASHASSSPRHHHRAPYEELGDDDDDDIMQHPFFLLLLRQQRRTTLAAFWGNWTRFVAIRKARRGHHLDFGSESENQSQTHERAISPASPKTPKGAESMDLKTIQSASSSLGLSPILLAASHGLSNVVHDLLREQGTTPESVFDSIHTSPATTPLHACARWTEWSGDGGSDAAAVLLKAGTNPNIRDEDGITPLMLAVEKGDSALGLVDVLLKNGALICGPSVEDFRGRTVLHTLCSSGNSGKIADRIFEEMAARKIPLDEHFDQRGWSPLHTAAKYLNVPAMQKMLSEASYAISGTHDYDKSLFSSRFLQWVDWLGHHGNAALHVAVASDMRRNPDGESRHSMCSVVKVLLDFGASLELRNSIGATPLHILSSNPTAKEDTLDALSTLELMVAHGAQIDAQDRMGNTVLHYACYSQNRDVALALVRAGARLCIANIEGRTPLDVVPSAFAVSMLSSVGTPPKWSDIHDPYREPPLPCMICSAPFTMTKRRHHCRHCGRLCCASCAGAFVRIEKFDRYVSGSPARVCTHCESVLDLGR